MHFKELERLQAVNRYLTLKICKEDELKEIAHFAAEVCHTPIALITLIDKDTQYFKVSIGTDVKKTSRADAFCNYVINHGEALVLPDTGKDLRFVENPLRKQPFNVQFYAGVPLTTQDGLNLGSLCVIDNKPNELTAAQLKMLYILSKQIIHIFEFDYSLGILKEQYLESKKAEIKLRALFESSASCHLLMDKDMKILFFNRALSEYITTKYKLEIKNGDKITEYIDAGFKQDFTENFHNALNGQSVQMEKSVTYQGGEIWWQLAFNPAYNTDGIIIGVSYNATNVSDLKKSKQETEERDQLLNAFAYMQAHDVRRPVSSIMGLMQLFKTDGYRAGTEDLKMMERAILELDGKIQTLIKSVNVKRNI